jgi:hypothetical protein
MVVSKITEITIIESDNYKRFRISRFFANQDLSVYLKRN